MQNTNTQGHAKSLRRKHFLLFGYVLIMLMLFSGLLFNDVVVASPITPTVTPTLTSSATPVSPPTGSIGYSIPMTVNLYTYPGSNAVFAVICPEAKIEYLSVVKTKGKTWYKVRVIDSGYNCTRYANKATGNYTGWVIAAMVSEPSYPVSEYVKSVLDTGYVHYIFPTITPLPNTVTPNFIPSISPTKQLPPIGTVYQTVNLRRAPYINDSTLWVVICPGTKFEYLSLRNVYGTIWYVVRVISAGVNCSNNQATKGYEGWVDASVVGDPSYPVVEYIKQVGTYLPNVPSPIPSPNITSHQTATSRPVTQERSRCDPSYPTICIAPNSPDLDCGDIPYRRFQVIGSDPHRFDGDNDGIGCER